MRENMVYTHRGRSVTFEACQKLQLARVSSVKQRGKRKKSANKEVGR